MGWRHDASCDGGRSTPDKPRQLFRVIARRESYGPLAGFINRGNDWLSNPTSASFPIFPRPRVSSALFSLFFPLFFRFLFRSLPISFCFEIEFNDWTTKSPAARRGGKEGKKRKYQFAIGSRNILPCVDLIFFRTPCREFIVYGYLDARAWNAQMNLGWILETRRIVPAYPVPCSFEIVKLSIGILASILVSGIIGSINFLPYPIEILVDSNLGSSLNYRCRFIIEWNSFFYSLLSNSPLRRIIIYKIAT